MVKPSVVPFGISNERWRITFHSELKFWSAASSGSKLTDRLPAIFLGREPAALSSQLRLGEHWRTATVPMDRDEPWRRPSGTLARKRLEVLIGGGCVDEAGFCTRGNLAGKF